MKIDHEYRTADITPAVYFDLSVSEKIRHHLIMAGELRMKAGPMFRMSEQRHLTAEEMPREWHDRIAEAKGHEATADRLQRSIRGSYGSDRDDGDDGDDVLKWAREFAASRKP